MPTRLTRYIVGEIIKIFVVALVVLTVLMLFIAVGRTLLRQGLGAEAVLRVMPFLAPLVLQFAMPATALFAVCCVYGRMAADGEISTVKASGISPVKLLVPAFVFAALLSPLSVVLSDLAKSWGEPGLNRVVLMSVEDIAYRVLRSEHFYQHSDGFSIHVREVDGHRLIHPSVTIRKGVSGVAQKVTATEGELTLDPESMSLVIKLVDMQVEGGDKFNASIQGVFPLTIPLTKNGGKIDPSQTSPGDLPLRLISRERIRQDNATHATIGKLAAHTAFSVLTSRPAEIASGRGRAIEQELSAGKRRLLQLRLVPWRRWAEGFTCFFFVLVGAPLAMIAKSSDYWTTFGLCFLPTQVIYYPLFILGKEQAKHGMLPPWGVWLGHLVLVMIGTVLIARVRRY